MQGAFIRGVPVVAMQVSAASFAAMIESPSWITDEDPDALRKVTMTFSAPTLYAMQIREAIAKRKSDGHYYILLISLRDEKLHLMTL